MTADGTAERVITEWVRQLATPLIEEAIAEGGQVEVRLFANKGQVRKDPVIVLNAGPSSMVSP